jgi:hypothetical protein
MYPIGPIDEMPRHPTRRSIVRRPTVARPLLHGILLLPVLLSCIDTQTAPGDNVAVCAPPGNNLSNVVFITAGLGDSGVVRCSGIAITRTLIVTALGCVTLPSDLAASEATAPGSLDRRTGAVHYAGTADVDDCVDGVPTEDGSFSTLYSTPLDPDVFNVYLDTDRVNEVGYEVSAIVRVPATRCSDGIALLELPSGIGLNPVPIRATTAAVDNEPLVLSYISVESGFALQRNDSVPAPRIVAAEAATSPSFELSETCPQQSGGGLFSSATGALVGIVTSSAGAPDCTARARGSGVALAPFRRMLIEASLPERLLIEGVRWCAAAQAL